MAFCKEGDGLGLGRLRLYIIGNLRGKEGETKLSTYLSTDLSTGTKMTHLGKRKQKKSPPNHEG